MAESIAVGADYGLAVIAGAPAEAGRFVQFTLSLAGQKILTGQGFAPAK